MKMVVKYIFYILSLLFLIYLLIPNNSFPKTIENSVLSLEPADIEDLNRRGYYINYSRSDVLDYYKNIFDIKYLGFQLSPIRLNYPVEDAGVLIRDQARCTYLEELVFPFRESIYLCGFEPKKDSEAIIINGVRYSQKLIVKRNSSTIIVRVIIGLLTLGVFPILWKYYHDLLIARDIFQR